MRAYFGDMSTVDSAMADASQQYDLPGALSYIWNHFTNMQNIGGEIVQLQRQASANAVRAAQLNHPELQQQAQQQIQFLGQLDVMAGNVLDEIDSLETGLQNLGLDLTGSPSTGSAVPDSAFGFGQEPLTIAAALALAVAVVGTMTYVFYHTDATSQAIAQQGKVLDMLQAGQISASQATQLMKTTSDTSAQSTQTGLAGVMNAVKTLAIPAAIVAVAVFVVPELSKFAGKRR